MKAENEASRGFKNENSTRKDAEEIEAERMVRQSEDLPATFEERARRNSEKVKGIHEFRRGNIREYEPPERDLFDYDPEDKSRKYDGLKLETIFRFDQTFKAIKWGICVGALFAGHRYFRTRSIDNAAFWFSTMSFVSFTNIWIAYGLQNAAQEISGRKSISMQARHEYHSGAYKAYVERLSNETRALDSKVMPTMTNEKGRALDEFKNNYIATLQALYGTEDADEAKIEAKIAELKEIESARSAGRLNEVRELTPQEKALLISYQNSLQGDFKQKIASLPFEQLEAMAQEVFDRTESVDFKSYTDWHRDPDCCYVVKL